MEVKEDVYIMANNLDVQFLTFVHVEIGTTVVSVMLILIANGVMTLAEVVVVWVLISAVQLEQFQLTLVLVLLTWTVLLVNKDLTVPGVKLLENAI